VSEQTPVQVGDRVRDTKWGGEYVGTVTGTWPDGDVEVKWDGHFAGYQMSAGEYERISK
jgi:hypothetical protein